LPVRPPAGAADDGKPAAAAGGECRSDDCRSRCRANARDPSFARGGFQARRGKRSLSSNVCRVGRSSVRLLTYQLRSRGSPLGGAVARRPGAGRSACIAEPGGDQLPTGPTAQLHNRRLVCPAGGGNIRLRRQHPGWQRRLGRAADRRRLTSKRRTRALPSMPGYTCGLGGLNGVPYQIPQGQYGCTNGSTTYVCDDTNGRWIPGHSWNCTLKPIVGTPPIVIVAHPTPAGW
jgi:hypothetical protein